jgi:hypothetical protein
MNNLNVCSAHNYLHPRSRFNTTGATSAAGTAYPSGAPEFNPIISGIRVSFMINALYIAVYPVVLFLFAIVLSVILRFSDSAYPFG